MLIFRLFEDTRHIGPMAERQTIAGAVKCIACHFHSMPLRAGENRGSSPSFQDGGLINRQKDSMFIQQAMARRAFTSAVKSAHCLSRLKAGESNGGVWSQRASTPAR